MGYFRKPDPAPSDVIGFRGEVVATVEWGPDGVRPVVMPMHPDCVPDFCRDMVARWLVVKAAARLVELTPEQATELIFGDAE